MILYQVATAVSTLSPALCLHAAGAGDMGRVAALAPGTRLLCTDQAALPLGLGLASLATLPPLLLAAGSLARAFRSQGGRCRV